MPDPIRLDLSGPDKRCRTCLFFSHLPPDEPDDDDECDGYCMNATGHEEYGGHWTSSDAVCELWKPEDTHA